MANKDVLLMEEQVKLVLLQNKMLLDRLNESQRISKTGSWSWDLKTNEVSWSAVMYELMGYEAESINPSYEIALKHVHNDDKVRYEKSLTESIDNCQDYYLENRISKTDTSIISVISRGICITDEEGVLIRMAGTIQDVTEHKRVLAENKRLLDFSNILSHDIKSPLRTISSFIGLIKTKTEDQISDESKSYLDLVEKAAKSLSAIVDDILTFNNLKSDRLNTSNFNSQDFINHILLVLTDIISSSNAEITIKNFPLSINGDRPKLIRVVQNLILNGIKYAHPDRTPEIEINCSESSHEYHISVSDNGLGISKLHAIQIFDPYYRIYENNESGSGIGLSICSEIVELNKGKIWVEQNEINGSTFHFTLGKEA